MSRFLSKLCRPRHDSFPGRAGIWAIFLLTLRCRVWYEALRASYWYRAPLSEVAAIERAAARYLGAKCAWTILTAYFNYIWMRLPSFMKSCAMKRYTGIMRAVARGGIQ